MTWAATARGMWTTSTASASGASGRSRRAMKTSGNVTERPAVTTIQGASIATSRPSSRPTSSHVVPAEHGREDRLAGDREHAGEAADGNQRKPRGGDDVMGDPMAFEPQPGERHGGGQPERRGGGGDDRRPREVRVPEARNRTDSLAGGQRQAGDVRELEREREGAALTRPHDPASERRALRSHARRRHRSAVRAIGEDGGRDRNRNHTVHRHPGRDRADPVRIEAEQDQREAEEARRDVADCGGEVVVERRERARGKTREELAEPGEHDQRERVGRGLARLRRAEPGEEIGERIGEDRRGDENGDREHPECHGPRRGLLAEPALVAGARQRRQDDDPDRVCSEREDDEDGVGRKEAVGLGSPSELTGDDHAHHRCQARLHGESDGGDRSRRKGSEAARAATLAHRDSLRMHTDGTVRAMATDTVWTESDYEALRRDFGDVYGGRTVLVTGADGFMGSHLTEALLAVGANVHAFVRATSSGALNNIGHRRHELKVHFADLTDRTSVDYLDSRAEGRARPPVHLPPRRPGACRRVLASAVRDVHGERHRHAQSAPVDRRLGPRAREVRHCGNVGGVRQRPRERAGSSTISTMPAR